MSVVFFVIAAVLAAVASVLSSRSATVPLHLGWLAVAFVALGLAV
jgi:hypothetical protein